MQSDRTYKAPVAEYTHRLVFSRFKYAEEAANRIDKDGFAWVMFREDDRIERETYSDGSYDDYSIPQFVVLWNE